MFVFMLQTLFNMKLTPFTERHIKATKTQKINDQKKIPAVTGCWMPKIEKKTFRYRSGKFRKEYSILECL